MKAKRRAATLAISLFIAISLNAAPVFSAGPEVNANKVTIDPATAGAEMREALDSIKRAGASDENMLRLEKAIEAGPVSLDATALSDIAAAYAKRGDCRKALQYYEKLLPVLASPHAKGGTEALYGAAYCEYKLGDMTAAKARLEAITENPLAMAAERAKAVALSNEIESVLNAAKGTKPKFVVGALLPLNGPYARFGEAALKGMLLAAGVFGKPLPGDSIEIAVKDTSKEGTPVEDLVDELLEEQEIAGIIGPLMGAEATEASAIIQARGIPAIMLSQKEGLTQSGGYAFRNFLTPKAQAERLAEYAAKTLGLKTAVILSPGNAYGKELTSYFEKAFTKRGGLVSGELSYEPGKKDFAKELVSLFGIKSKEKKEGRRRIVAYTPTIRPGALVIFDSYGAVAQIAPYLAFYGIKNLQLLGAGGWNSPKLIELGGEYVEGAVFVDGFFAGSKRKGAIEFVKLFKNSYDYDPGIIEAYAYDSTSVLLVAAEKSGNGRKAVRNALAAISGFEGATGKISFNADTEAGQELFVLKVEKGSIVEVEAEKKKP